MVPYVRRSFYKHYKDGMKYINDDVIFTLSDETIDSMDIEDYRIYSSDNVYYYAYEQTKKEVHQAVEGMFHNLNTLQSRSGELIAQ